MEKPDDIVGHKTFDTGEIDPATGFPVLRHEPLTRADAEALLACAEQRERERAERMPDEQSAVNALFEAWQRLKELGWNGGIYCPKDGTSFRAIELGSTGIFDCVCEGKWPHCTWTTFDKRDAYPSSQAPALFRLYPEDQAKHDQRMAEAREKFATPDERVPTR